MEPRLGLTRHVSRRWLFVAFLLLAVGIGCLTVGLSTHHRSLAAPVERSRDTAAIAKTTATPSVERSDPVSLRIPAIGLSAKPLVSLGLNADRTVQVPTDILQAGWYRYGPTPGQQGSAVILGHVDSYRGPAVFFNLRALEPGDQIDVTLADGNVAHFTVTSVAMFSKLAFPATLVYGPHGGASLQLVTCGGAFDEATGSYLSNVVVFSSLSGVTTGVG